MLEFQIPTKQPPNKLSDLLELALNDLEAVKKIDKYKLDMGTWHAVKEDGYCYVCMAGAVMANTLKTSPEKYSYPEDYEQEWELALQAIDLMREGHFFRAFSKIGQNNLSINKIELFQELHRLIFDKIIENESYREKIAPLHIYRETVNRLREVGL